MTRQSVPKDSRYVPFVQQPYCCVPTCIQMILYKNRLDLLSQEEIGAELGLVVPPQAAGYFCNVEVSEKPPVKSGFGTRIQLPEFGIGKLIEKQNWPFRVELILTSKVKTMENMIQKLSEAEQKNSDVFVCFQNDSGYGHVCVFDRVKGDKIRLIDPSPDFPKWRNMDHVELFNRVQKHGDENLGGLWELSRK